MASDLQAIVDSLGERLKRAVAVDDLRMRLQAYSSHHGRVDDVRLASILHREAPKEAKDWALSLGIASANGPVRVRANRKIGMDARICAPIRYQDQLLGYLWLIEGPSKLTVEELAVAASAADSAGEVMYREQLLYELERGRERELLRDLVSSDDGVHEHAAEELVEANIFVTGSIFALVVYPVHDPDGQPDETVRVSLTRALDGVRRSLSPRHSIQLVRPNHGLVVVATRDPALRARGPAGLGEELHDAVRAAQSESDRWSVIVGIGDPQCGLAAAITSYHQAQQAARVGQIVRSFGPVVFWSQLGIYRMLSEFPVEKLTSDALHPGLVKLFEHRDADPLVGTLERYLDSGGDVKATSISLTLHRASLYYRLHRIEEIAGASVRNGDERLALHLGLKLARLAGIHPFPERS